MKHRHTLLTTAAAVAITVALSGPIMAADAPVRKSPGPAVEVFNWSGFYLGGHVGYGTIRSFVGAPTQGGPAAEPKPKGFLVGLHAGQNIQTAANWLWGWEVDVTATPGWNHIQ